MTYTLHVTVAISCKILPVVVTIDIRFQRHVLIHLQNVCLEQDRFLDINSFPGGIFGDISAGISEVTPEEIPRQKTTGILT